MSLLDGTLSELARMRSGGEPIVSLYLDIRWGDEQQRERVRLFVQDKVRKCLTQYPPGSPGREGLGRTLQRVQEFVAGLTAQVQEPGKNGLALFANEALQLWRAHTFRRPFQPELCTDHIPHLAQLARLADDHEPAVVIVADSSGADLYQVLLGDVTVEESVRGVLPRRPTEELSAGAGATNHQLEREAKDQRHTEASEQRNRRRAVEQAVALCAREPRTRVVLVGTAQNLAAFERELPDRLRAAVIARVPRPREWESGDGQRRDGVVANANQAIQDHERHAELKIVDEVVGQSLRGGLAVLGPDDVVMALNEGRVHRLVLEEDFVRAGWRCTNCDALGSNAGDAEACPYCGGSVSAVQYLGEALVARTLGEGGEVEVVAHTNKLHSYRSVAAFLRQSSGTGMRGARAP